MVKKSWKKGIAAVSGLLVLTGAAVVGMYFLDQDVNVGEYKGVVSGFDPLAEAGGENIVEEKGIIPAHALGITNIMAEKVFGDAFQEEYLIRDVREGGYYRITKEMQVLDGKAPMVVVDNQTGAVIQMSMIA